MGLMRLGFVHLRVTDLEEARNHYSNTLGMAAALQEARTLSLEVCVAVTDRAGHLLAFARMDHARILYAQIAQDKAYSVAAFGGLPTSEWWPLLESDPPLLHSITKTYRLIVFGGGVPLVTEGHTIGGSGGSSEQDAAIAKAGATVVA
jgi:glc operon protein GlcG